MNRCVWKTADLQPFNVYTTPYCLSDVFRLIDWSHSQIQGKIYNIELESSKSNIDYSYHISKYKIHKLNDSKEKIRETIFDWKIILSINNIIKNLESVVDNYDVKGAIKYDFIHPVSSYLTFRSLIVLNQFLERILYDGNEYYSDLKLKNKNITKSINFNFNVTPIVKALNI